MNRKHIIVAITPEMRLQTWGNFKKCCLENGLPYHTLKALKLPIKHDGWQIYKTVYNEKENSKNIIAV